MFLKKNTSVAFVALIFAMGTAPKSLSNFLFLDPVLAQSASTSNTFEVPNSVAKGTKVQLDGSESTSAIDKILKQDFEKQFADTQVNVEHRGSDAALEALREGKIDVVGIGRPLTKQERAQGLREISLKRHKIAILVGADNPFQGSLTIDQFAKIFRGEITDWSEVGGAPGKIKLVDFPDDNDTRQALQNYPVFQRSPFKTGTNAVKLQDNTAAAAIEQLGSDGITYVLANRVGDLQGARALSMHKTTPDDPRYPFSQSLYYVYNSAKPSSAAKAFLGYVTAPNNQQNLNEQLASGIVASVGGSNTANAGAGTSGQNGQTTPGATTPSGSNPNDTTSGIDGQTTPGATTPSGSDSNNITTGTDGQTTPGATTPSGSNPNDTTSGIDGQNGQTSTEPGNPTSDRDSSTTASASETAPAPDAVVPPWLWWLLPLLAIGGGLAAWLLKKGSGASGVPENDVELRGGVIPEAPPSPPSSTTVASPTIAPEAPPVTPSSPPSVSPTGMGAAGAAGLAGLGLAGAAAAKSRQDSRAILVPRNDKSAYAYWEVAQEAKQELKRQGGQNFALRLYDSTDVDLEEQQPRLVSQYKCEEASQDLQVDIPRSDRDYLIELGYTTDDDGWLSLAKSEPIKVFASSHTVEPTPETPTQRSGQWDGSAIAGAAGIAGAAAAASAFTSDAPTNLQNSDTSLQEEEFTSETPTNLQNSDTSLQEEGFTSETPTNLQNSDTSLQPEGQLVLTQGDSQHLVAEWEVPQQQLDIAKSEGGEQLKLRLSDVTDIDLDEQPAHSIEEYPCDEGATNLQISIPRSDRDYLVELGYTTSDGDWLSLARSTHAQTSASDFSNTEINTLDGAELVEETTVPTGTESTDTIEGTELVEETTLPTGTESTDTIDWDELDELVEETTAPTQSESTDTIERAAVAGAAGIPGVAAASTFVSETPTKLQTSDTHPQLEGQIVLTARDSQNVYAYWEMTKEQKDNAKSQGGEQLKLRLYEVTDMNLDEQPAHSMQEYSCDETARDMHMSVPTSDRDYLVELGYTTSEGNWLRLARSTHVRVSAANAKYMPTAAAEPLTAAEPFVSSAPTLLQETSTRLQEASGINNNRSRIILVPGNAQNAYAYWEIDEQQQRELKGRGAKKLALRLYDVTNLNPEIQKPLVLIQYECQEMAQDFHVQIPTGDRDYQVELGYLTEYERWLSVAKSATVRISS
jgi:phosphate transport system substrate-binding protein